MPLWQLKVNPWDHLGFPVSSIEFLLSEVYRTMSAVWIAIACDSFFELTLANYKNYYYYYIDACSRNAASSIYHLTICWSSSFIFDSDLFCFDRGQQGNAPRQWRSRGRGRGRGGFGYRIKQEPVPTREQLDNQLDQYMAGTKTEVVVWERTVSALEWPELNKTREMFEDLVRGSDI